LSFRELDALRRRRTDQRRLENYRMGLLASLYYNSHKKKSDKPRTPFEWFGDAPPPKREETAAEILAKLDIYDIARKRR
jgi:hypothetical protein